RSCWVVLVKTGAARNSVRLTLPSWMKPKPFFCVGRPMFVALPLCRFGRITSKPIFSYMLRRCGILKSWLSPSRFPLKSARDAPSGSAWQRAHEKALASRRRLENALAPLFGLAVAVAPPPDWLGTVSAGGIVSSRLREGAWGAQRGVGNQLRVGAGQEGDRRVAEVPGDVVEVDEDVARRAADVAVAGGELSVVEELAARLNDVRARIEPGRPRDADHAHRRVRARVHDRDRVVEAVHDVEARCRLLQGHPARPAPD